MNAVRNRLQFNVSTREGGCCNTLNASTGGDITNVWTHAAGTYDGSTMRLYLNGVKMNEKTTDGGLAQTTNNFRIGGVPSISGATVVRQLVGKMADVGLWDRALTSDEVALLASDTDLLELRGTASGDALDYVRRTPRSWLRLGTLTSKNLELEVSVLRD